MYTTIHFLLGRIKRTVKLACFQAHWRRKNTHNDTCPMCLFPEDKVEVGNFTYGDLNIYTYRNKEEHLKIGSMCSIASNVIFVLGGEHNLKKITTYPILEKFTDITCETNTKGPIIVGDDVWIGTGAVILSGVSIGQGAVIGSGSIVAKDIPPYSIYAAGRVIRKRFPEDVCKKLYGLDYSVFSPDNIHEMYQYLNVETSNETIDTDLMNIIKKANLKS